MQRLVGDALFRGARFVKAAALPVAMVFVLSGCVGPATLIVFNPGDVREANVRNRPLEQRIREKFSAWEGGRYRFGGTSPYGMDCSALVMKLFGEIFGIALPRTSLEQSTVGYRVARAELEAGDLVFFKTPSYPYHVGVYLSGGEFVHASSSLGVSVSNMGTGYWRRYFWTARRIPDLRKTRLTME